MMKRGLQVNIQSTALFAHVLWEVQIEVEAVQLAVFGIIRLNGPRL
jgi:hypothetical protein